MRSMRNISDLVSIARETHRAALDADAQLRRAVDTENAERFSALLRALANHQEGICGKCFRPKNRGDLRLVWGYITKKPRVVIPVCTACYQNMYSNTDRFPLVRPGDFVRYRSGGVLNELQLGKGPNALQRLPHDAFVASRTVTRSLAYRYGIDPSIKVNAVSRIPKALPLVVSVG